MLCTPIRRTEIYPAPATAFSITASPSRVAKEHFAAAKEFLALFFIFLCKNVETNETVMIRCNLRNKTETGTTQKKRLTLFGAFDSSVLYPG